LIDELVALSVIENRKKLEEPHRIDWSALVDRVVRRIRERSATVTINQPVGQQAFVSGDDEFLLENAVTNLLQNAIEIFAGSRNRYGFSGTTRQNGGGQNLR
jgi:nitrogen fixation/metabolism regulation signal transduction histidine kinase